MTSSIAIRTAGLRQSAVTGLLVHLVASVVFMALSLIDLEGCDRSGGLMLALLLAIVLDLVLSAALAMPGMIAAAHRRRASLAGWGMSYVPALILVVLVVQHINTLQPGCPV